MRNSSRPQELEGTAGIGTRSRLLHTWVRDTGLLIATGFAFVTGVNWDASLMADLLLSLRLVSWLPTCLVLVLGDTR